MPDVIARIGAAFVLLALIAPGGAVAQTPTQTAARPWQDEVRDLLTRRAAAVMSGDEGAFRATMTGASEAFVRERLTSFRRLRSLPVGLYRLDMTQEEYEDLARNADRARHPGSEVHVVQVKERIGFRGYDARPSSEDVFLTVVKGPSGWSVVADDDVESLALQSNRYIWDFGTVSKLEDDGMMVVFHPAQRAAAPRILALAKAGRARVRSAWPVPWREDRVIIMIPSTVDELARILQTTFDLSTFVAFAAASVDRATGWRLSGNRVFLHWPNFRRQGEASQRNILQHEFAHRASFEVSGLHVPAFMDEGIAQYYGEQQYDPPTPELRQRVRSRRFDRRLPQDFLFIAGPPSDIYLSYEESVAFASYIGRRFGRPSAARLYRAVGAENPIAPGTARYHLDRACRATLGVPFATLQRDWARDVIKEHS